MAENLTGVRYYEMEEVQVAEYHPLPDGLGDPTQVHLIFRVKGSPVPFVLRFKGTDTLDQIIAALKEHGRNVFGPGGERG